MSERTEHGIRVGAIEVTALVELAQGAVVGIRSGRTEFDVSATPKGRDTLIRMPENADSRLVVVMANGDRVTLQWNKRWGGSVFVARNGRYLRSLEL